MPIDRHSVLLALGGVVAALLPVSLSMAQDNAAAPAPAFHFTLGFTDPTQADDVLTFQEVSGLTAQMETEAITEGGENRFAYRVPTTPSRNTLELKRGFAKADSLFLDWVEATFAGDDTIKPADVTLSLIGPDGGEPVEQWNIVRAYPVAISVAPHTVGNVVGIETLEFQYTYFERRRTP